MDNYGNAADTKQKKACLENVAGRELYRLNEVASVREAMDQTAVALGGAAGAAFALAELGAFL